VIRTHEDRRREVKAQGLGGPEIDDQLECGWLLDREVARLGILEDLGHVAGRTTTQVRNVDPIGLEAPGVRESSTPTPLADDRSGEPR
jgi:hypothetical protein